MSPNASAALARMLAPTSGASENERAVALRLLTGSDGTVTAEAEEASPSLFLSEEEAVRLDAAEGFHPSPDQTAALATLLAAFEKPGEATLVGAAGAGKSSLMKALLRRVTAQWSVLLLAPTWRAANRLTEVAGRKALSVHSAIYGAPCQMRQCPACKAFTSSLMEGKPTEVEKVVDDIAVKLEVLVFTCECGATTDNPFTLPQKLDFPEPKNAAEDVRPYRLVVIDEASMLNDTVAADARKRLLDGKTRLLFLGDANQLQPVERGTDPDPCNLLKPTAALTQVHRQAAGNPILALAHTLLSSPVASKTGPDDWPFPRRSYDNALTVSARVPLDAPAMWAAGERRAGTDVALIALSNTTRAKTNLLVRHYSHAETAGQAAGTRIIPGDRLLVRSNNGGLTNGELWEVGRVERVPGGTALLNESSRADRGPHRDYEVDTVLGKYVLSVWKLAVRLVGTSGAESWRKVYLVLPLGQGGLPVLESDVILWGGPDAQQARDTFRNIAYLWKREYAALLRSHEEEWQSHRARAEGLRAAMAAARESFDGSAETFAKILKRVVRNAVDGRGEQDARAIRAMVAFAEKDEEKLEEALGQFANAKDCAADCATSQEFCEKVYGAIDPEKVIVADWGECLTCHAMQGSQAEKVGVVFDGACWGLWRNDRMGALKWAYTAVTRASKELRIFQIQKGG